MKDFYEIFLLLLGFASILFLAYVTSRLIAGKSNKALKGKHLSVIETLSLGADKRLYLIKSGKRFILLASSSKNIEYITDIEIDDEEKVSSQENINLFDFKSFFEKYVNSYKDKKVYRLNKNDIKEPTTEKKEETRLFKNNLEKLKDITNNISKHKGKGEDEITNEE